jgi:hypothetical protein
MSIGFKRNFLCESLKVKLERNNPKTIVARYTKYDKTRGNHMISNVSREKTGPIR